MGKKVLCQFEIYPNYIAHLLCAAGVAFGGQYSGRYKDAVDINDRQWLTANRNLLEWGGVTESPLSSTIVFLAGYLNLSDVNEIRFYFETLQQCIDTHDMELLLARYPRLRRLDDWIQGPLTDPYKLSQIEKHQFELSVIHEILERNFPVFENSVIPEVRPEIEAAATEINALLSGLRLIEEWETQTHQEFKYSEYVIVLSDAMERGPNFNSLGYEKNWVYYKHPKLLRGIVHEIGTHLLIRIVKDSFGRYEPERAYKVYETLCHFLSERVANSRSIELEAMRILDAESLEMLRQIYSAAPGTNPESAFSLCMTR